MRHRYSPFRVLLWCVGIWALLGYLMPVCAWADNWPNWRGPFLDGTAAGSGYAVSWSPTNGILWRVALPGLGASTPAVWGERIVVTCAIEGKDAAICLDRTGKQLWRRDLGVEKPGKHKKATGCNPSPVTDGKYVWVYYKSGESSVLDWPTALAENPAFKVLGEGTVGEMTVATPVCVDGRMFLRTHDSLWCIGKK